MSRTDLMRGTLDLLILRALMTGANHGLGIARRVEQMTQGAFRVNPGSLFPALHRLEQKGWLTAEWGRSETNRKAKYYALTPARARERRRGSPQLEARRGRDRAGVARRGGSVISGFAGWPAGLLEESPCAACEISPFA